MCCSRGVRVDAHPFFCILFLAVLLLRSTHVDGARRRPNLTGATRLGISRRPGFAADQRVPGFSVLYYWISHIREHAQLTQAHRATYMVLRRSSGDGDVCVVLAVPGRR